MKKIILNGMYDIGGGIGAWAISNERGVWAISNERGVKLGDCREIGEILMHASSIYKRGFFTKEVWWTPVDKAICHDYDKLREWRCRTGVEMQNMTTPLQTPLQTLRDEIERLKAVERAAIPGPWFVTDSFVSYGDKDRREWSYPLDQASDEKTDEFIAESRTALPRALAVIEVMMEAVEFYAKKSSWYYGGTGSTDANDDEGQRARDNLKKAAEIMKGIE